MSNRVFSILHEALLLTAQHHTNSIKTLWQEGAVSINALGNGAVIYSDPTGNSFAYPNGMWVREEFTTGRISIFYGSAKKMSA
jgi:hypothetical protein